jgi:hypothetical protein
MTTMPTEMLTTNGSAAPPVDPDDELRAWARKHVERVHRLKRDAAVYLLGMLVLTGVWAAIQWQDNGAFERFADGDNPGDWEPWIFIVALVWGFFLVVEATKTYFDRPASEAEVDRAIERLRRT